MRNNMTDREKKHLRELVGEDGQAAHYFVPAAGDLHKRSHNKTTPSKNVQQKVQQKVREQVLEMRRAAAPGASLTSILSTVASVVALQREVERELFQASRTETRRRSRN